jgi:D-amino-acid dehydrogenase
LSDLISGKRPAIAADDLAVGRYSRHGAQSERPAYA